MAIVNKNLKFLRAQHGLTQRELAEKLGLKQASVGAYEEERATPPVNCLMEISNIFNVSLDHLINSDISKIPQKEWKNRSSLRGKDVLAITVDSQNRENVELVTQRASAGYLSGYQDPEFVKELPKVSMPVLPRNKTYRAFEIKGDSMLPIHPGSIIFGEYLEDINAIRNGKPHILVTRADGIVFKRAFRFEDQPGHVLLVSDNRLYEPYPMSTEDLLEVWAARAFFSQQFPEADATTPLSDQLALKLLQLQQEKKTRGKA